MQRLSRLGIVFALGVMLAFGGGALSLQAATLGPGPKVSVSLVAPSIPTLLQYAKIEKSLMPTRSFPSAATGALRSNSAPGRR